MNQEDKLAMLVLSCDKYSDLWDDFFNLKERFWADCPYKWYIVTESKDYQREGVTVIKCGSELNWAGRFRYAVKYVNTPLIGCYLEDYFIKAKIDNSKIEKYVDMMLEEQISFLNLSDCFKSKINLPNKEYYKEHLFHIPQHLKYGIDTAAALWNIDFLLGKLGNGDYSAWQFEVDRCKEATSEKGLGGLILCDDEQSFNVSEIPVVIQGVLYPDAVKFFEKEIGYKIVSNREIMSAFDVCKYKFKCRCSRIKRGRKILKWIGTHILGYKFFTKD